MIKLSSIKSIVYSVLLVMILIVLQAYHWSYAMNCKTLDSIQMEEIRADLERSLLYMPIQKGRATVHLYFNLDQVNSGESIFLIYSTKVIAPVYRGVYKRSLSLEMDANLAADDGYDNLEFKLLWIEQKKFCYWVNERGYPYWCPGAEISIEFLPRGIFDNDNLFKKFEVIIR